MCSAAGQDDYALIERYRSGDEDALRVLLEQNRCALQGWLRNRMPGHLARRVSVADVLQEVQIVAFRRRADFVPDGPGSFRTWLIGIAENKARETIRFHDGAAKRAARREVTRGQRADTAQFASPRATPSQYAIAHEAADRARQALDSLSEDDREVLRLAREMQLPLREVAERMGRSYEAGRKLYVRALVRFKAAFDCKEQER